MDHDAVLEKNNRQVQEFELRNGGVLVFEFDLAVQGVHPVGRPVHGIESAKLPGVPMAGQAAAREKALIHRDRTDVIR